MAFLDNWIALEMGAYVFRFLDCEKNKLVELRSILAVSDGSVLASGSDAFPYLYKDFDTVQIKYPISHANILYPIDSLIEKGLDMIGAFDHMFQPCVAVLLPSDINDEQLELYRDLLLSKGIRKLELVRLLDLWKDDDLNFMIHAGHSYTEIMIVSHGRVYAHQTIHFGGMHIDEKIQEIVFKQFGVSITRVDACNLKMAVSRSLKDQKTSILSCTGIDASYQLCTIQIPSRLLYSALVDVERQIVLWAKACFEQVELSIQKQVLLQGITLSGGLANCFGLVELLKQAFSCDVFCTNQPQCDMINALKEYIDG